MGDDGEVVAAPQGVVVLVGNQDDGDAPVPCRLDGLQDDFGLADAERRGRLVKDQHPGAEVQGAGDDEGLAFTAGHALAAGAAPSASPTPCALLLWPSTEPEL